MPPCAALSLVDLLLCSVEGGVTLAHRGAATSEDIQGDHHSAYHADGAYANGDLDGFAFDDEPPGSPPPPLTYTEEQVQAITMREIRKVSCDARIVISARQLSNHRSLHGFCNAPGWWH